jgi:AcrR family transcriptional regulator
MDYARAPPVAQRAIEIPMPAATRTPRSRWVEAGLDALAAGGPEAVRVETLAQSLGVTKGGFYWHFTDRRALLAEMLDTWERAVTEAVIERVESEGGDARAKLRRLFALAEQFLSQGLLTTELTIRNWGRADEAVARRLRRIDNRRMEYMRSLFAAFCRDEAEVEARCMLAFSLFIGNHFVAAEHGSRTRTEVLQLTLAHLLDDA